MLTFRIYAPSHSPDVIGRAESKGLEVSWFWRLAYLEVRWLLRLAYLEVSWLLLLLHNSVTPVPVGARLHRWIDKTSPGIGKQ